MSVKQVPEGWTKAPLRSVTLKIVGGGTPSRSVTSYWNGEIPWASVKDFRDDTFVLNSTEERISIEGLNNSASSLIEGGVVVICTRMAVGRAALSTCEIAINQDLKAIYPCNSVLPNFLLLLVRQMRPKLEALAIGSTVKGITLDVLLNQEILLPSPPEQRRIAAVLDALDETIAASEAVVAKLRALRQGLLHDLLTCGIDDNGELRDPQRHPQQFKDSLVGRVPKEWEVTTISSVVSERPKNGYSPKDVNDWTGTLMLGLGCLTEHGFEPRQIKNAPRNDARLASAMLTDGDILISRSNTQQLVGLVGTYRDIGHPCIYPDLMMRLRPNGCIHPLFLELTLRSPLSRHQIERAAQGTSGSMVKINAQTVLNLLVTLPSLKEQICILTAINTHDVCLRTEEGQLAKLRQIKAGLMDDLLSGRVRVPEDL